MGHGVLDRARRRRQRRDACGPAARRSPRRSTTSARTPSTSPASSSRRRSSATHDVEKAAARRRHRHLRDAVADLPRQPRRSGRRSSTDDAVLVSLMKGVELGTLNRMSEVIAAGHRRRPGADRRDQRPQPGQGDRPPRARRLGRRVRRRGRREDAAGPLPLAGVPALHLASTCSAASSAAPTRTSSASPSAWRSGSASATTPPPR